MKPAPAWLALLGWIGLTFLAPAAGFRSMPDAWYAQLAKPAWNPPNWIFAPVWTSLYLAMAVAAWLVWRRGGWRENPKALSVYLIQLSANALWSPLFFGRHQPLWALIDIAVLWLGVLVTLAAFARVSRPAAWLLAPYMAWVTFASALNFSLWQLNR